MRDNVFGPRDDEPASVPAGDDEPAVDLRALAGAPGAASGAGRWEALAARVEAAAAPELARRAAGGGGRGGVVFDLVPVLARALRPALFAAAAALLAAVGLSRGVAADSAAGDEVPVGQLVSDASVAQALRVREADAPWLAGGEAPSREALARAIGVEPALAEAGVDPVPGGRP
jgi:hypothetical protein